MKEAASSKTFNNETFSFLDAESFREFEEGVLPINGALTTENVDELMTLYQHFAPHFETSRPDESNYPYRAGRINFDAQGAPAFWAGSLDGYELTTFDDNEEINQAAQNARLIGGHIISAVISGAKRYQSAGFTTGLLAWSAPETSDDVSPLVTVIGFNEMTPGTLMNIHQDEPNNLAIVTLTLQGIANLAVINRENELQIFPLEKGNGAVINQRSGYNKVTEEHVSPRHGVHIPKTHPASVNDRIGIQFAYKQNPSIS